MVPPIPAVPVTRIRGLVLLVRVLYLPGPSLLAFGIDLARSLTKSEPPRVRTFHQVPAIRTLPTHNRIGWILPVENNLVGTRSILGRHALTTDHRIKLGRIHAPRSIQTRIPIILDLGDSRIVRTGHIILVKRRINRPTRRQISVYIRTVHAVTYTDETLFIRVVHFRTDRTSVAIPIRGNRPGNKFEVAIKILLLLGLFEIDGTVRILGRHRIAVLIGRKKHIGIIEIPWVLWTYVESRIPADLILLTYRGGDRIRRRLLTCHQDRLRCQLINRHPLAILQSNPLVIIGIGLGTYAIRVIDSTATRIQPVREERPRWGCARIGAIDTSNTGVRIGRKTIIGHHAPISLIPAIEIWLVIPPNPRVRSAALKISALAHAVAHI